ncbi:polyprenyl synthetase family protein [Nocardioides plantarum]|uniref:Polyprenyl synthetase family protein n=1 Tax=Nocardioides plantarum TaxID=29299 RepID=A0ABV5KB41_9ACTN|nr:polyprenyl synthetase family protein [Nocardioides plantarum]
MLDLPPVLATPHDLDPAGLSAVEDLVTAEIERNGQALAAIDPSLRDVSDRLVTLVQGGKRLRAAFCLWGARAAAGPRAEVAGATAAAAALELFHLAALVHDDVMDRSERRRGGPTVHHAYADRHGAEGYGGDARTFGDGVAVLVGDLCLTWSDDLLGAAQAEAGRLRPARARRARQVWEEMRLQVIAGQYLDLLGQARPDSDSAAAHRVLTYKSAKYTVEHPLLLGAALGGADAELLDQLSRFGRGVGEAFQLRDDVLGLFGDPDLTGKSVSDDVREGKRTLLITSAEESASPDQRRVLARHLGDPDGGPEGLRAVREVVTATGALALVEERIEERSTRAHEVLGAMSIDEQTRRTLGVLSDACAWRVA